jgi:hypothetical protein
MIPALLDALAQLLLFVVAMGAGLMPHAMQA